MPIATSSSAAVPGTGSRPTAPVPGRRAYSTPSRRDERREAREQREVDAERVGVARPRLDAVEAHPHERGRRGRRARAAPSVCGSRPPAQHSSQTPKSERSRRRPASARAARGRRSGSAGRPREARATTQPTARPIARHGLSSRKTSPNSSDANGTPTQSADEDRGRREVVLLGVGPRQAGVDDGGERGDAQQPEHDVDRDRQPHQPPLARLLQPRRRPQRGERDERHHEHARRRGREQRLGDRQVGAADEAVGEDGCEQQREQESKNDDGPAGAGPSSLQNCAWRATSCRSRWSSAAHRAGGRVVAFGAKSNFTPKLCFLLVQPVELDEVRSCPSCALIVVFRSTSDENTSGPAAAGPRRS